ncbi:MAG: hypothetical protein ACI8RZ_006008 [Myxococcota bacterium]|jgi:hypothetical protein
MPAGRLFSTPTEPPDIRPAMMSVAALMVLLLPALLMATSAQKLTGLALSVPGPSEQLPPEPTGAVEKLSVSRLPSGYLITAHVRSTDVLASVGDTERKELLVANLTDLQIQLAVFKGLDGKRQRITLVPGADTPTEEVVRWMDAVRRGPDGELYPRIILETAIVAPPAEAPLPRGDTP